MKKLSFIIVFFLCANVMVFAQKGKVTSAVSFFTQGKLDKAKELIDEAIVHENCVNWAKAYFVKGQIYQALFESQDANFNKLSDNALKIAWDAYQEVIKLDEKKKFEKDLKVQFQNLSIDYTNQGVTNYNKKDYASACADFKKVLEVNASPYGTQKIDTAVIFNAAMCAQYANNLSEAEELYKEVLSYKYEPNKTYALLANVLLTQSKKAKEAGDETTANAKQEEAVVYLIEGNKQYPDDEYMLIELINFYLAGDEPEKAEVYLDAIIKQKPDVAQYYRSKGLLYEKINKEEEAEKMYLKTLELDPNDFFAQYSLGNIHLNRVIKEHDKVSKIVDNKQYNAAIEVILDKYEAVVPYFERALEIEPNDRNTVSTLKELYFRLREKNGKPYKDYNQKYEEMDTKLKSL